MSEIKLPDVVTNPKTGRYLLTPAAWNSEGKQALYEVADLMPLMDAMKKVFTYESPIDKPRVVNVTAYDDGTFTYGLEIDPMIIDQDGFITLAPIEETESGQGLVEYALILVMVVIVVIVVMVIFGPALANIYSNIAANL